MTTSRSGTRVGAVAVAAIAAVMLLCGIGAAILTPAENAYACATTTGTLATDATPTGTPPGQPTATTVGRWNAQQVANAAIIINVGAARGVPSRGWVIAVATAMTESSLINTTTSTDHDSVGLFQQRPSQGWGSAEQLADPSYASGKFYDALLAIPGWEQLPLTVAAQRVERSAYPERYATYEDDAIQVVAALAGQTAGLGVTNVSCPVDGGDGDTGTSGGTLPSGFTLPVGTPAAVVTAISWALQQLGTPYHYGGDCTAPHSGNPSRQCDCSSLMQMAYRAAGVVIPRTTGDQVRAGTGVASVDDIRPGDLVLVPGSNGTASRPGHVGMYIGEGLLVQAPHTGDVVKISSLSSWKSKIVAIRRVVQ